MLKKTNILGVGITDASEDQILEYAFSFLHQDLKKGYIVTPNPEIVTHAQVHPEYLRILNEAEIALCDGVGLRVAAQILGKHLSGRITGVDLMENLCKRSIRSAVTVGFLGGKQGVALRVAECLARKYPGLRVGFIGSEWDKSRIRNYELGTKGINIEDSQHPKGDGVEQVDILFVAYGFPKQEEWIFENLSKIPVRIAMGVGGAFDYLSGEVPRAPFIIRAIGGEWLFRLIVQPWRLKRQFSLLRFLGLVLKARVNK